MNALDRDRLNRRLAELLDRIDAAEEAKREAMKKHAGRIGALKEEVRTVRDLLAGRAAEQLEIPHADAADGDDAAAMLARAREGGTDP